MAARAFEIGNDDAAASSTCFEISAMLRMCFGK